MGWPANVVGHLASRAHVVTYEPGSTVFHAGESADLLYVLLRGEVKIYYGSEDGERLLVTIARSGQLLGFPDLTPDSAAGGAESGKGQIFTAEALSSSRVALIAKTHVIRQAQSLDATQLMEVLKQASSAWERLSRRSLEFLTMDIRSRLARVIEEIADGFGIPDARGRLIRLRLSHEDFGELVGASRPMVSKHLKDLAVAGVFFKDQGKYVLARADALCSPGSKARPPMALTPMTGQRTLPKPVLARRKAA
jgi:CRP/FNR family transcriptional regulator